MKRKTSFGTMETLVEREGQIVSELLFFEKEGRSHQHDAWEICHIIGGSGTIVIDQERVDVQSGDICNIPPNAAHWMIPDKWMEIILVYTNKQP